MAVAHDFQCPREHITEHMIDTAQPRPWRVRCGFNKCRCLADYVVLPPSVSRSAIRFQPAVIYQHSNGDIINPGRAFDHLPKHITEGWEKKGYRKTTLDTFPKYRRSMQAYEKVLEAKGERERARELHRRHEFHQEIWRRFRPQFNRLDSRQQELAREAHRQLGEQKPWHPSQEYRSLRPGVFLDSFENDSVKYNDADTKWRDRGV